MRATDLMYLQYATKELKLSHQCKTENGITDDEKFTIDNIVGNFEQVEIVNQYGQTYTINPNQIENEIV